MTLRALKRFFRFYPLTSLDPIISEKIPPVKQINYPSGIAVRDENADVWYIKGSKRFKMATERVVHSWNLHPVEGATWTLEGIPVGGVLGFRDGTLLSSISDGKMYLVSDNKLRQVTTPEALYEMNLSSLPKYQVSQKEIELHNIGEPISG